VKTLARWLAGTPERRLCLALLCLCAVLYVPLAGNYGMWDPWETHYGEIARQMAERNDWVSLWWPGSPTDRVEVFHKPVLHFWLMALSMKAFGLEHGHPPPDEMVRDWRAEWACRLPNIALSILAIWAIWQLVTRLAGRRAGALAALILATSTQWALITRQAMTDMPFVSPMTIALALAGLALLGAPEEFENDLPRRELFLGGRHVGSVPQATSFWVFLGLLAVTVVPQLLIISIQVSYVAQIFRWRVHLTGLVPMLPYWVLLGVSVWWCARARTRRQIYLFAAYLLAAVATLAKGPAGVALPGLVLLLYLLVSGRWRDLVYKLELPRGAALFITAAFPWYHAMLLVHGSAFWMEFIGDNYVRRAEGRHGDRGTFEYYLQWIGYGMFPWSGLVTLGGLFSFARLRDKGPHVQLTAFALVWFLVEVSTMSIVNTKFHHYILPALPALAILTALFIDELLRAPTRAQLWGLVLIGLPMTLLCGRDLAAFPPRLLWEFNYDYVNMPGTGRPWPQPSQYGDRFEYAARFGVMTALALLALAALVWVAWRALKAPAPPEAELDRAVDTRRHAAVVLGLALVTVAVGIALGPRSPSGLAPHIGRWAWIAPTLLVEAWLGWYISRWMPAERRAQLPGLLIAAVAVLWTGFVIDGVLVETSPHWAQKHLVAAYYKQRKGADEPLLVWQLYWRGENFYTRNEIFDPAKPATEKTVFLGDRNSEKLQEYVKAHAGRRVFFLVERIRYEALRNLLPEKAKSTLTVVDDSNNKIYLASAQI
jgi:4-amino-4-deoxy-L-arabinose transferase-like glycosyltransferase